MSDAATDAENFDEALEYELRVIRFESTQARMKLALAVGDPDLIDEVRPELAAAAAAVRTAKAPEHVVN